MNSVLMHGLRKLSVKEALADTVVVGVVVYKEIEFAVTYTVWVCAVGVTGLRSSS